jgi:hypothetical protein
MAQPTQRPLQGFHCRGSTTLGELQHHLGVSTVLECEPDGTVPSRAVAMSNPDTQLHSGRSYIPAAYHRQRLANRTAGAVQRPPVTFSGKVSVTEFELATPSTPQSAGVVDHSTKRRDTATSSVGVNLLMNQSFTVDDGSRYQPPTISYVFEGTTRYCSAADCEALLQRDYRAEAAEEAKFAEPIIQRSLRLIDDVDRSVAQRTTMQSR